MGGPQTIIISNSDGAKRTLKVCLCVNGEHGVLVNKQIFLITSTLYWHFQIKVLQFVFCKCGIQEMLEKVKSCVI